MARDGRYDGREQWFDRQLNGISDARRSVSRRHLSVICFLLASASARYTDAMPTLVRRPKQGSVTQRSAHPNFYAVPADCGRCELISHAQVGVESKPGGLQTHLIKSIPTASMMQQIGRDIAKADGAGIGLARVTGKPNMS